MKITKVNYENGKYIIIRTKETRLVSGDMYKYLMPFLTYCHNKQIIKRCCICDSTIEYGIIHGRNETCTKCIDDAAKIKPENDQYVIGNTIVIRNYDTLKVITVGDINLLYDLAVQQITEKPAPKNQLNRANNCRICEWANEECCCYRKYIKCILSREICILLLIRQLSGLVEICDDVCDKIINFYISLRDYLWRPIRLAIDKRPYSEDTILARKKEKIKFEEGELDNFMGGQAILRYTKWDEKI